MGKAVSSLTVQVLAWLSSSALCSKPVPRNPIQTLFNVERVLVWWIICPLISWAQDSSQLCLPHCRAELLWLLFPWLSTCILLSLLSMSMLSSPSNSTAERSALIWQMAGLTLVNHSFFLRIPAPGFLGILSDCLLPCFS